MFWIDYWYIVLVVPALLIAGYAQIRVSTTFRKYSGVSTRRGLTGAQAALTILQQNGLHLPVEQTAGSLTDHFDPRSQVIRLSEPVYGAATIAAVGVAAHETGHALQHAQGYAPIRLRSAIVKPTQIASALSPIVIVLGIVLAYQPLAMLGVALFGLATVFQLVTLPVEFNASASALRALREGGMMNEEELRGAKRVLSAAAMTYVASLLVSLMSLLRLRLIVAGATRRGRR